jgi:DNA polymerase-3 subunit gamma/tau
VTNEEHLALLLTELIKAEPSIRSALFPRIALEMTLLRLSMMSHFVAVDEAIKMFKSSDQMTLPRNKIPTPRNALLKTTPAKEAKIRQTPEGLNNDDPPQGSNPLSPSKEPEKTQETTAVPQARGASLMIPDTDMWNSVLEKIEGANAPLASKLREGSVSVSNEGITILFNGGVSVLAESVKENITYLKESIKSVTGKSIPIRVETKEVKSLSKADLKEKALNNPVVREALELFDGRIVDISPINHKDNNS